MADSRCPNYELRVEDCMIGSVPGYNDGTHCCKLQDNFHPYDGNGIDGICNADDFNVCPFYFSRNEVFQE